MFGFFAKEASAIIEQTATNGAKPPTYTAKVESIVNKDGSLSDFKSLNDPGYDLAYRVVEFMEGSPKWNPAIQNGNPGNCYHTQPVTFPLHEQ